MELNIPQEVRFELARPGMAKLAAQVQQSGSPMSHVYAGGTRFSRVEPVGQSGTVFIIDGAGFLTQGGWAYLPDPADKPAQIWLYIYGYRLKRYQGDWFLVQFDPYFNPF